MLACQVCGTQNPSDAEFCLSCAAALGIPCPRCAHRMPADSRFCGQCGSPLAAGDQEAVPVTWRGAIPGGLRALMPTHLADKVSAIGEIQGERRDVCVMFADISDFTPICHRLGSEDAYFLIDEAMRCLVDIVYRYEGTVDKFTGDGLMALFGAPMAHEDEPERAVRAALEIQQAMRTLSEKVLACYGVNLRIRIGLHVGPVIAGRIGSDLHMEYTVIGDTVNLARRLESVAEPGTVLVSFEVYQRTSPVFDYRTLPPAELKGVAEPVRVYKPLGLREHAGRVRGIPCMQAPMVGRHEDLGMLLTMLDQVKRLQASRIAIVTGQAGLGKSRLVAEFRTAVSSSCPDVRIFQGACVAYARSRPLWLMAKLLSDILGLSEADSPEVRLQRLDALLDRLHLAREQVLPYVMDVLGIDVPDPEIRRRLHLLDAPMLQQQTHAALRQVLLAQARSAPTVLIFEDMHWVDSASRGFVEYFLRTFSDEALMVILVSREPIAGLPGDESGASRRPDHGRWVHIRLDSLSAEEGQILVDHLLRDMTDESRPIRHAIAARAAGNPFYVEEVVRMLIDHGGLAAEQGRWCVTPAAEELLHQVPGTLSGLVLARFDQLSVPYRRLLQNAAVLGTSFPRALLEHLTGEGPERTQAQLTELMERQFLVSTRSNARHVVAFRHALIHGAIYSTLLRQDRMRIHEQAAQMIEGGTFYPAHERVETLAHHYFEGAEPSKAVPYLLICAERAALRCAYGAAADLFRRAATLAPECLPGREDEYFRIRLGLGRALKHLGKLPEACQVLSDSLKHVLFRSGDRTGWPQLLSVVVQGLVELADVCQREGAMEEAVNYLQGAHDAFDGQGPSVYPGLWRLVVDRMAWVHFRKGDLDQAYTLAQRAAASAGAGPTDDPLTVASLHSTVGGILWQRGNLAEAVASVERSLELYEASDYSRGLAKAYTNLGVLYYALGRWTAAAENLARAGALWEQIGDVQYRALNLNNLGVLHQSMGRHAEARPELERALAIRQQLGDHWGIAQSQASLAHLDIVEGRFEEAAAHAWAALDFTRSNRSPEIQSQAQWIMALVQAEQGQIDAALDTASQPLVQARAAGPLEQDSDCYRVLGLLWARKGDIAQAETCLRRAVEVATARDDPYREGLALMELGRLYARLVRSTDPACSEWQSRALQALDLAAERFDRLGATRDRELASAARRRIVTTAAADQRSVIAGVPGPECAMELEESVRTCLERAIQE